MDWPVRVMLPPTNLLRQQVEIAHSTFIGARNQRRIGPLPLVRLRSTNHATCATDAPASATRNCAAKPLRRSSQKPGAGCRRLSVAPRPLFPASPSIDILLGGQLALGCGLAPAA